MTSDIVFNLFLWFRIDGTVYQYKVDPFGLQSACSASKFYEDQEFTLHYVYDILFYSENIEELKKAYRGAIKTFKWS